jgi:hypothetical protein
MMMPARSEDPLRRVTLNLYEDDCITLEQTVGHGWTELIRRLVNAEANLRRTKRTLGDFSDE